MDALVVAIIALGVTSSLAVVVAGLSIFFYARSSRELRDTRLRETVVERVVELATMPEQLAPALEAVKPLPDPVPVVSKKQAHINGEERNFMVASHLDPDDPEDVDIYVSMRAMNLNPLDPSDVAYYNELGEH